MFPAIRNSCKLVLRCHQISRSYSTSNAMSQNLCAELQKQRGLVMVEGVEAAPFLQGLLTNDINHLEEGATSMYSMLLNPQGRVLFETIVYRKDEGNFFLECDNERVDQLVRHLRMYKVRRKLNIHSINENYRIWCVFDSNLDMKEITHVDLEALYLNPHAKSDVLLNMSKEASDVLVTQDPRMKYLGYRLVVDTGRETIEDIVHGVQTSKGEFKILRYKLGVGEGTAELPPTKCLPLEANCDYLHGVSFHKGCYVGQELTARTFHTGVIRKRYMPLTFTTDPGPVPFDSVVVNEKGRSVGKVRGADGKHGIALLRVEECLNAEKLAVNGFPILTYRPAWWPIKASKEKKN